MTKVSIITPLFNRAHVLQQTAESVMAQTHADWEWIVVDDGSTDNGPEMILAWADIDPRIHFHSRAREPKGACTCRNIGAQRAQGDFIVFLDSDDLLAPICLEQRIEAQTQSSNLRNEVFYFSTVIFDESPHQGELWDDPDHPEEWVTSLLKLRPPCQSTGPFWPSHLWLEKAGWNEALHVWQDVELHLRSHFNGIRFIAAQDATADFFHRVSPDSISRKDFHSEKKVQSRLSVLQYALEHLREIGMTEEQKMALGAMGFSLFRTLCNQRKFDLAATLKQDLNSVWPVSLHRAANEVSTCCRWKLDRLGFFHRRWDSIATSTYPSGPRRLGRVKWRQAS